jgi:hypothetical protein
MRVYKTWNQKLKYEEKIYIFQEVGGKTEELIYIEQLILFFELLQALSHI